VTPRRGLPGRLAAGALAMAVAFSAAPAGAVDFIIYSQNLLRFGHGSRTGTQCTELATQMAQADIILIQEWMLATTPCTGNNTALPGTYTWRVEGPYGKSTYKEYYTFLYTTTARSGGPTVRLLSPAAQESQVTYMRPPYAHLFEITPNATTTKKTVWVVNFHAVWGKAVKQRRDEATNITTFYTYLRKVQATTGTLNNVIIGGDWNLATTDTGFDALKLANASVIQTDLTSLNRTGGLSQSYDHFVISPTVVTSGLTTIGGGAAATWRTTVSDHLGIRAEVTLP
jgi:endonuclease/exonuclease/phosphatase family metal-dependent hydrolase